jgi:hypothetical protein
LGAFGVVVTCGVGKWTLSEMGLLRGFFFRLLRYPGRVVWGQVVFCLFFELGGIFTLKNILIWADRRNLVEKRKRLVYNV